MGIPVFNAYGLLPEGIHDCTLEEVEERFGRFAGSDQRPRLWATFKDFLRELRAAGLATAVLINGSFVTSKAVPNDLDIIVIVESTHDFARDLSPAEYNVLSAQRVKRRHRLDMLVARADSDQYRRYVALFQQVRLDPDRKKGILRLTL